MRKTLRKSTVTRPIKKESFTITEMFERFMWMKNSEGLAPRTIEEYQLHFKWLMEYLEQDIQDIL